MTISETKSGSINMTRDVYLFEHVDGGLVRVTPTIRESFMGRRMAATLTMLCREVNRRGSHSMDTLLGRIEIHVNNRKKGRGVYLNFPGGELKYPEVRTFILLACQYSTGEFPYLQVDFDGKRANIILPSGRDLVDAFAGVDVGLSNTP